MTKGTFITFEGGEGAGKSTILQNVKKLFENKGFEVVVTREPGGTQFGEALRDIVLDQKQTISAKAEFLLFLASRVQHIEEVIKPALASGKVVLCDRFTDSSIAYQGSRLGMEFIESISETFLDGFQPNCTLLLDLDPAIGFTRCDRRGGERDRLEQEAIEFHQSVRQNYLALAKKHPERISVIDASCHKSEVSDQVERVLQTRFFHD